MVQKSLRLNFRDQIVQDKFQKSRRKLVTKEIMFMFIHFPVFILERIAFTAVVN